MGFSKIVTDKSYWENLTVDDEDTGSIINTLFELEKPLRVADLIDVLIKARIAREEAKALQDKDKEEKIFLPKDSFSVGDLVAFPTLNWETGEVIEKRQGSNPEFGEFSVISVLMANGKKLSFASDLADHKLNTQSIEQRSDQGFDLDEIFKTHFNHLEARLVEKLNREKEIVRVGDKWFPKALLIDFNQGHLNIAEAILDMQSGGPMEPHELLKQMDVALGENRDLNEFSINYALKKDHRFDEVGSTGIFSWFLKRQEPLNVREKPEFLNFEFDKAMPIELPKAGEVILESVDDELEPNQQIKSGVNPNTLSIPLIYPHWQIGSIPLIAKTNTIFPSALETERVKIQLIEKDSGREISAWVVRPFRYVYGLKEWYEEKELIPGSIITIEKSEKDGLIYIQAQKRRSNREWMKTVLIGADGEIVIALLKQPVTAGFHEQMAIALPDPSEMAQVWKARSLKPRSLKSDVFKMVQELSKLNAQRHIHFVELYAAVNLLRRCPPSPILQVLFSEPEFSHVGDQYFHLNELGTKE